MMMLCMIVYRKNDYVAVLALAPGVHRKGYFSFDIMLLFCLFAVL